MKSDSHKGWQGFLKLCEKAQEKEIDELFGLFFTYEEREDLARRYVIIKALIEEQLTQREIAEECGVSISKITRGSNALKIISPNLLNFLKKHFK